MRIYWHARKTGRDKEIRGHLRQLQALGLQVTVTEPAAYQPRPPLAGPATHDATGPKPMPAFG